MRTRRKLLAGVALLGMFGVLATGALAAGCTTDAGDEPPGARGALEQATGTEWIVDTDPTTGAITFAAPKNGPFALPAGPVEQTVLAFLDTHKAIFKMHDPKAELVLVRVDRPSDGSAHVRFVQKESGVPVFGGTWIAHVDNGGRLTSMSGSYAVDAHAVSTTAKLTPDAAASAAIADAAAKDPSVAAADLEAGTPSLEVFPVAGGKPVLAWAVKVRSKPGTKRFSVTVHLDDGSSKGLATVKGIIRKTASAPAPQTYEPYNIDAAPLTFLVSEDERPKLSAKGPGDVQMSVYSANAPDEPVTATTAEPWADPTTPRGAAIAAQAYAKIVLEYYLEHTHGPENAPYRSVDGAGAVPIKQVINDPSDPRNAYWLPDENTMYYGDGSPADLEWPTSASLDTVAHELSHGVTEFTSKLEYIDARESAAINESMSDVFAALITHRVRGDDAADFTFSEDDNNGRVPIRSMIQPTRTEWREGGGISVYSDFKGGDRESHIASNIPSHAFYLLTHGDTHEISRVKVPCGIGWAAADRLYWRLQTNYVQPTETFKNLALHSLAAARELGINTLPVACSWVAVGVLSEDEAKNDWSVTCERDGDGGTDAGYDSGNILVTAPAQLVECPVSLTGGGVSLGGQ